MMSTYIQHLADHSCTPQHELILECLEHYGVFGTRELIEQQVREFCENIGISERRPDENNDKDRAL